MALEVCDDRIYTASSEPGGALLGPCHCAYLRAAANEFLDERAADLAASSGDEDDTQDSTGPANRDSVASTSESGLRLTARLLGFS